MKNFTKNFTKVFFGGQQKSIYWAIEREFDRDFYLRTYHDVAQSGADPVRHYIAHGHNEGRDPTADFSTRAYLMRYPDVTNSGVNAFYHYLKFGRAEKRDASAITAVQRDGDDVVTGQSSGMTLLELVADAGGGRIDVARAGARLGVDLSGVAVRGLRARETCLLTRPAALEDGDGAGAHGIVDGGGDMPDGEQLAGQVLAAARGKVLSFDIWDTVLRRNCAPDEVKLRNARAVWLTGVSLDSQLAALHPLDLFQLRRWAEAAVADESFEYRIGDVGALLPELMGVDEDGFAAQFLARELAIEKCVISPDEVMVSVLARHEGRKLAISDFYMPGEALTQLLEAAGLKQFDKVYASCDHMATKRRGDLFAYVLKTELIPAGDVLHVGDRYEADYASARRHGLEAVHYYSPSHQPRLEALDRNFWAHVEGDCSGHGKAILEALGHKPGALELMAVAVAGFALQVMETALRMRVGSVFFCTREGVFFKRAYDLLVARDVFDLGRYPDSVVLEVSRKATFAASLDDFSVGELMRLWSQYSIQSPAALAGTLNIDPALLEPYARRCGVDMNKAIALPWADDAFRKFIGQPRVQAIAREAIWAQRGQLLTYLEAVGFAPGEDEERLIVDIGWRGTIQDNIARLVKGNVTGCYFGLEQFLNPQAENVSKRGFIKDENREHKLNISEVAGLEFLFNAPGGSTIGYRDGKAVRDIIVDEEALVNGSIAAFQNRLVAAVAPVADYVREHGLISTDITGLAREIVADYCRKPPKEVADAFFQLSHNESFGMATVAEMGFDQKALRRLTRLDGALLHGEASRLEKTVRWSAAWRRSSAFGRAMKAMSPAQKLHLPAAPAIIRPGGLGRDRVAVLSPAPILGSGGHRTIFNLAGALARQGYDVHLMHESPPDHQTEEWIGQILGDTQLTEHSAWCNWVTPRASVATVWYSAFYHHDFWRDATEPFYFVQDMEAAFNPVGDTYLKAMRSYSLGASHICVGRWLAHALHGQFGVGVASGGLGVDHKVYRLDPKIRREQQVALLFQPEKSRRAPQLCSEALAIVKQRLPETKIVLYGSNDRPYLPFDHEHLGLITDVREINTLYNQSVVGLCVSSTNPSRIPFEMMASGCVPVDIFRYNNLFDYDADCGLLAHDSPESLAEAICMLLIDERLRAARAAGGMASVADRSLAWETDAAVNAIGWRLEGGDFDTLPAPRPTYDYAPVVADTWKTPPVERGLAWERLLASQGGFAPPTSQPIRTGS